jgi:hypothetical protein
MAEITDRDLILHQISQDLHRLADLAEDIWGQVRPRLEIVDAYRRGGLLAARAARKRMEPNGDRADA